MEKVLIEVPDGYLTKLNDIVVTSIYAEHVIKCGKPLSDKTNGDVITMMFPEGVYGTNDHFVHVYIPFNGIIQTMTFDLSWWNAPYEEGKE